ncbi:MAG: sigma-70 family RNA polymerase sigma factor [Pirellulaceae bacterium]
MEPNCSPPDPSASIGELIRAARGGSREALGELLGNCRQYLLVLADRLLPPRVRVKEAPSDIVQQTCLDAQQDFIQFAGCTREELVAWLRQILLHNLRNTERRYQETCKRDVEHEVVRIAARGDSWQSQAARRVPTPSSYMMLDEKEEHARRVLDELPEDYRTVIMLHHRDKLSFEEVATQMGRSEAAVRKLWVRAVQHLQQRLEQGDAAR